MVTQLVKETHYNRYYCHDLSNLMNEKLCVIEK